MTSIGLGSLSHTIEADKTSEVDDNHIHSYTTVNIHDPFLLWTLFVHSDRTLIRSLNQLSDVECSHLYWSCHYHKYSNICQHILDHYAPIRIAHDAMQTLSYIAKSIESKTPDLTEIPVPFLLPTSPDFLVVELRDASYIPSNGRPLKFTVVNREGKTKTYVVKQ
jgi:hypothetical protein